MELLITNPKTNLSKTIFTKDFTKREYFEICDFYDSIGFDIMVKCEYGKPAQKITFKDCEIDLNKYLNTPVNIKI